jgi:hypothetical protein
VRPEQKVRLILIGPAVLAIVILSGCFGNKKKANNTAKKQHITTQESRKK